MSLNKIKTFSLMSILMLAFSTCYGSQSHVDDQMGLVKAYISQDAILFQGGCMLIVDGQNLLRVKTLHQDSNGMYYYYSSLYGYCPNGHPYTADGGCLGYDCPYN